MKKLIIAFLLSTLLTASTSYAIVVSMAIQVINKDGIRSKQGDIIAIKPSGWQWGKEEVKRYLIIEVDLGSTITTIEDARKLEIPQFEDGSLGWPSADTSPAITGKRRFKVAFTDLSSAATSKGITLDLGKMAGDKTSYQPLQKTTLNLTNLITDKVTSTKVDTNKLEAIKNAGK